MSEKKIENHPGVAAVLSFLFSGVGQIYNGQIAKGLFLVAWTVVGLVLVLLGALAFGAMLYQNVFLSKIVLLSAAFMAVGGAIVCATGIYSIVDAYKGADK